MAIILRFPRAYRLPPPPERAPLDALQDEIRDALANAVTLTDALHEALAVADELAEIRGER